MNVAFRTNKLKRLVTDLKFNAGFAKEVIKAYRKRIQAIRAANDERDLRNVRSNRFEKLGGERSHQHSMRLNEQWRLVFEITRRESGKIILIYDIEDYH
jgi:proteic killer suppression protein